MPTSQSSPRLVTTDLNLLITPAEWQRLVIELPSALVGRGFAVTKISATEVSLTCEPDNMLVSQFEQIEGRTPMAEALHRVLVYGTTKLSLVDATAAVAQALPEDSYWYGTTVEGELDDQGVAACAWAADLK